MNALSPAVLDNGDVLRRFADARPIGSYATLAKEFGRDASNMKRTVLRLVDAGALRCELTGERHEITADGRRALQALDLAEGRISVPEGYVALHHAQIFPDALNPRSDFDSEEHHESLGELISDILQNGLLQNLLVRPSEPTEYVKLQIDGQDAPMFRLISGERRWRAIGVAIHDGDWPADRLIPCQVIETDDMGHSLRALAENLQRRSLSPIEEAKAFSRLVVGGMSTQDIADRVSVTQRQVQLRLQLLELPEAEQARMELPKDDPQHLSVRDAKAAIQKPRPVAPEPETLPAGQLLILLETAAKIRRSDGEGYYVTEVSGDAQELGGEDLQALVDRGWLYINGPGYADGRFNAQLFHSGRFYIDSIARGFIEDEAIRVNAIDAARKATGANQLTAKYATSWLNGPFELTPEGEEIVAARAAEAAAAEAKETAAREAKEAALTRGAAFLARAKAVEEDLRKRHPKPRADVAEACAEGDAPLPWSINAAGDIVDALGRELRSMDGPPLEARRRLLVAGINALGGFATPEHAPEPPPLEAPTYDVLSREDFEASMAACIAAKPDRPAISLEQAAKLASKLLTMFLGDNAIAYGAADCSWTKVDAEEIASQYDADPDED